MTSAISLKDNSKYPLYQQLPLTKGGTRQKYQLHHCKCPATASQERDSVQPRLQVLHTRVREITESATSVQKHQSTILQFEQIAQQNKRLQELHGVTSSDSTSSMLSEITVQYQVPVVLRVGAIETLDDELEAIAADPQELAQAPQ